MSRIGCTSFAALAAVVLLGLEADPAQALTRSHSGKTFAAYAESPADIQTGVFNAVILKGKKKNVLVIETTATVFGGADSLCIDGVTVNGVQAYPTTGIFNVACTGVTTETMSQTVSATYWFDIDEGETIAPGSFYNVPVTVTVDTGTNVSGLTGSIAVVVRMEKK